MAAHTSLPLSVLNTAPIWSGSSPAQSLREAIALAPAVEELGYVRYWVAEHHNSPSVASSAPVVLVGRIAAATTTLRVGSGGVMLPNHTPLVVAEQFGTLEALYPGRIDLGIGRAPGTDPVTAAALRRAAGPLSAEGFPQQLGELIDYFEPDADSPRAPITAFPAPGNRPPVWLLGSSLDSARLAGALGLPYAYAHHFSPGQAAPASRLYRASFRPSAHLAEPYLIIAASVVVADTDEEAARLALPTSLGQLWGITQGPKRPLPTDEEAAAYPLSPVERQFVNERLDTNLIGGPDRIRTRVAALVEATGADELMATTSIYEYPRRVHSYELLAKAVSAG